jgi:hypothetical protein
MSGILLGDDRRAPSEMISMPLEVPRNEDMGHATELRQAAAGDGTQFA